MAVDNDDREIGAVGGIDFGQPDDTLSRHRDTLLVALQRSLVGIYEAALTEYVGGGDVLGVGRLPVDALERAAVGCIAADTLHGLTNRQVHFMRGGDRH